MNQIFQVGENCLKIQGPDGPIVVEVEEGMPYVRRNRAKKLAGSTFLDEPLSVCRGRKRFSQP